MQHRKSAEAYALDCASRLASKVVEKLLREGEVWLWDFGAQCWTRQEKVEIKELLAGAEMTGAQYHAERVALGLSQVELAQMLGVTHGLISQRERGLVRVTPEAASEILALAAGGG